MENMGFAVRAGPGSHRITSMDGTRQQLLRILDSREFKTGAHMGAALGLTRAAVHKHIRALVEQGVPVHRVPGRGYRLADGVSLLDGPGIQRRLSRASRGLVSGIEVAEAVDSTSVELSRRADSCALKGRVCLAEKQTAGRGRRGRSWVATPYRDLMMSIAWVFPRWPAELPALGLASSLMIVEALEAVGADGLELKWPNDIVHQHGYHYRKVCGVLLDATGETQGDCRVIIGVGINVSMAGEQAAGIDQPWLDLETLLGQPPDRNVLVAECLNRLMPMLDSFTDHGFAGCLQRWRDRDALAGRAVSVTSADGKVAHGKAAGIDDSGRLRFVDEAGVSRLFSQGDVSVRLP